jgi:hypothetical protein
MTRCAGHCRPDADGTADGTADGSPTRSAEVMRSAMHERSTNPYYLQIRTLLTRRSLVYGYGYVITIHEDRYARSSNGWKT